MRSIALVSVLVACSPAPGPAPEAPDAGPDVAPDAGADAEPALGPYDRAVSAADVSILYPLPVGSDLAGYIKPDESGAFGALLPVDVLGANTLITNLDLGDHYDDLRLIGLRLDPCSARGGCQPEVRVVFQPIRTAPNATVAEVGDGALHGFYRLPAPELERMLEEILAAKKAFGAAVTYGDVLGAQPILSATGASGPFGTALHAIVLRHLGRERLERVTVFQHIFPDQDGWVFAIFEQQAGAFVGVPIHGTGRATQTLLGPTAREDGGGIESITPAVTTPVVAITRLDRPVDADDAIRAGFDDAIARQNPDLHTSETSDCASCHLAEAGRRLGETQYALVATAPFTSARSLAYQRESHAVTNLHAFGYLGRQMSIMQRTANESARVADAMQAMLP